MEYRILGPLEVVADGQRLALGQTRERKVLAALLLEANYLVTMDRLVDVLWDSDPPAMARKQVRNCVSALRAKLTAAGAPADAIRTEPSGYVLKVPPGKLDAHMFARLVDRGHQLATEAAPAEAAATLREALSLWRGPALAGIDSRHLEAGVARLEAQRIVTAEDRFAHELDAGHAASLLAELTGLVGHHPFRERLRGQLMTALCRCGRSADALEVFQQGRRLMVEELGLEPGPGLQHLQRAILSGDLDRGAHPQAQRPIPVPAQLPADVAGFTGRAEHLSWLDAALAPRPGSTPVVVSAVSGSAGVGKTALAVHWAHQVRDQFPDGQLYVNLRGYAPSPPMRPVEALALFLRALGTSPERVPVDLDEATAAYRSMLSGRRVLLVLDNAARAEQVRPLLPASPGCVALVTSRDRLDGLVAHDGARLITVDVLAPSEAEDLLARAIGQQRMSTEPQAARELTRLCAHLPLALRIAGAQLAARPLRKIAPYAAQLAAGSQLTELAIDSDERMAVQSAFDLSYSAQVPETRLAFRRLSLSPGADVTAEAVAVLTGTTVRDSERALDKLASAHLVEEHTEGRFTFHDLLRQYAEAKARAEDSEAERRAAVDRLVDWYLATADAAARVLHPEILRLPCTPVSAPAPIGGHAGALRWLDTERPNLVATLIQTAEEGGRAAWLLADALRGYFHLRMHTVDWQTVACAGLRSAELGGDLAGRSAALLSLGDMHWRMSAYPQAINHYEQAASLAEAAGWREGQAAVHGNLGNVYQQAGQLARAAEEYRLALAMARQTNWATAEAANLDNLAAACWELGRLPEAAEHSLGSIEIFQRTGSRFAEGVALTNLAEVRHAQGRLDEAVTHLDRALALHRDVGNRGGEAETLRLLATVRRDKGQLTDAARLAHAALDLARDAGDRRYEADALNTVASLDLATDRYEAAAQRHADALRLARAIGNRYPETEALIGLAHAAQGLGRASEARHHAAAGLVVARQVGYRLLEAGALATMATIEHDTGQQPAADKSACGSNLDRPAHP